ncbi:MAG: O-antigen ligase family protein [Pyruvatibacter sp.]
MPSSWHHPAWTIASEALGVPVQSTISINPAGAPAALFSLLGTAAIFVVALYEGRDSRKARRLLEALAIIGLFYAVYGLVIYLTGNDLVAWAEKRYYPNSLSSTFVNRNTYGVFAGLGTLCAIALLVSAISSFLSHETRRADRLPALMSYLTGKGAIWLLAALVGTSALLLTGSRAANAAGLLGFMALLLVYLSARRASIKTISLGIILSLITGFLFVLLSGEFLFDRLEQADGTLGGRSQIYELVLIAISDHLWLGSGYGSFEDVYRLYAGLAPQFGPNMKSAHSVFLELTLELGLPIAIVFFASISICVGMCAYGVFKRRRDRIFPALAVAATLLVSLQGAVDFAVQTPAVAGVFATLLGIGVAQSTSSAKSYRR